MGKETSALVDESTTGKKPMYENIVVAFDNTDYSKAAVIEVANRIRLNGGKVVLVHAVYFDEEEFGNAPEQLEKRLELGKKVCAQTKDLLLREFRIEAEALVCEGEPPEVIVNVAREKNAELIAMGTYGRKGLKRLLMGSVTSGVIVNAPCDVLVVRKPCTECTGSYSSILVPFDGSGFSVKALERACLLSQHEGAGIRVLYVIPRYEEMVGFFKTESIRKSLTEEAHKVLDLAKATALRHGAVIETQIGEGHAADEIIKAASAGSDLIVMGTYGWKGVNRAIMGSTTERVIMNASRPILVMR